MHAWKPAKVYTFVPAKVSWLKCCALSAKSEQYSLVPGCRSSKERLRWAVGISQAIVLVGRLVILESCKKESRKIRCTNMNGTRQACYPVEAWLEFDVSNNDVFKKETCQNMSQHVNVNLTSQEPYGPKWHVQRLLWAMTAASLACPHRGQFAHLPKVNGGSPHCPYGLPFCLTGWAGYWQLWFMRRKGSKGALFFFQNPFPVEANFGNDFGFCQGSDGSIWYVLKMYWFCFMNPLLGYASLPGSRGAALHTGLHLEIWQAGWRFDVSPWGSGDI